MKKLSLLLALLVFLSVPAGCTAARPDEGSEDSEPETVQRDGDGEEDGDDDHDDGQSWFNTPMEDGNIRPAPYEKHDDVYLIESVEDLILLREMLKQQVTFEDGTRAQHAKYLLTTDLDLTEACRSGEGWEPIGVFIWGGVEVWEQYAAFSGEFDGNGHTIRGLSIRHSGDDFFKGLFGHAALATIKNLNIENCDVSGGGSTGAVAGGTWSNRQGEGLSIINCHVTGTVTGHEGTGGVVGIAETVENCSFTGTVNGVPSSNGNTQGNGGVAGRVATIRNCFASGAVNGHDTVGGVAGDSYHMYNCYFLGAVSGYQTVGGVAGTGSVVSGCYSAAEVSGYEAVGGVVGRVSTTYNVEADPIQSVMQNLIMMGPAIREAEYNPAQYDFDWNIGRIAGFVGGDTGANEIFCLSDIAMDLETKSEMSHYYYDGEDCTAEDLVDPAALQRMLQPEYAVWEDAWKPAVPGYYPQLIWETGAPVRMEL